MTSWALSGRLSLFTPLATIFSASMSRPESVSSRMASFGSSTAIWKISLRFFSPPEKPSLTERLSKSSVQFEQFHFLLDQREKFHRVQFRLAPVLADFVQRGLEKIGAVHAGNFDRILEREKQPFAGALLGIEVEQVLAAVNHLAAAHVVAVAPGQNAASVLLPLPFGPMTAWTSPGRMTRLTPLRICLPSTPASRFLISRIGCAHLVNVSSDCSSNDFVRFGTCRFNPRCLPGSRRAVSALRRRIPSAVP